METNKYKKSNSDESLFLYRMEEYLEVSHAKY